MVYLKIHYHKKLRIARNLPIIDKKTGQKIISRQVRYPLIGSEVCPFLNYVDKFLVPNINLRYSILIIEKMYVLEFQQYKCDIHDVCVLYKYSNGIIKHLEECEFWYNDKYWETIYPHEYEKIT
jgi:hypothetical protein